MRWALLAGFAALLACSAPPGARPPQGGEGGSAGGAAGSGGQEGGSGGEGGAGGNECQLAQGAVLVLERVGLATDPGKVPAVVTMHRAADPSEVPQSATGADRVLEITEVRNADARFRLWYHVASADLAAPVEVGDPVVLTYEEVHPWGRSAAAVLRDLSGQLLWVLVDGGFGDVPSAQAFVEVKPVGLPLCTAFCGFARHQAMVTVGTDGAPVSPGTTETIGGGTFWLAELATLDGEPACTDVPAEIVGYAWSFTAFCGGFRGQVCGREFFCSYSSGDCGAADEAGLCVRRPDACPEVADPVCGCDGSRYVNACFANASGTSAGGPSCDGLFRCGDRYCRSMVEYCRRDVSDVSGMPDTYACLPLPDCKQGTACECVASEPCAALCSEDAAGNVTVTCPGG